MLAGAQTALLIDELPVLAAIAPYMAGLEVRDAGELRVKESDRLSAVTQNLKAMGRRSSKPRTDGAFPAVSNFMVRKSSLSAIIASPWRSLLPHSGRKETLLSAIPIASLSPIPASLPTWSGFWSGSSGSVPHPQRWGGDALG